MAARRKALSLWGHVGRMPGDCPDCGFEALMRITMHHANEHGVTTLRDQTLCGRCQAEAKRERREADNDA